MTGTEYKNNFYLGVNRKWLEDPANSIPAEYPRWYVSTSKKQTPDVVKNNFFIN
jgi:hypothetical protein